VLFLNAYIRGGESGAALPVFMTYDAPVNVDFVYCMCVSWSNITEGFFDQENGCA